MLVLYRRWPSTTICKKILMVLPQIECSMPTTLNLTYYRFLFLNNIYNRFYKKFFVGKRFCFSACYKKLVSKVCNALICATSWRFSTRNIRNAFINIVVNFDEVMNLFVSIIDLSGLIQFRNFQI